jgi:rhodanese-related sulfurtransferase
MPGEMTLRELTPEEVNAQMRDHSVVLVDVREPDEFAAERIPGALLFPLSTFDPEALPKPDSCTIVFQCGSGKRSAMAAQRAIQRGIGHVSHMIGGIHGWKAAGLPTIS